jgi:uncharacterized OB-fold protein
MKIDALARPTKTNPFLFAIEGEEPGAPGLKATRCKDCGRVTLGRVMICQHCFSRAVEPVIAGRAATLVEHSIARHPAGGFEAPYVIGLLRTTEDVTLFAPVIGETEGLAPGEEFEFVTVPHAGGDVGFAYKARRNVTR